MVVIVQNLLLPFAKEFKNVKNEIKSGAEKVDLRSKIKIIINLKHAIIRSI